MNEKYFIIPSYQTKTYIVCVILRIYTERFCYMKYLFSKYQKPMLICSKTYKFCTQNEIMAYTYR